MLLFAMVGIVFVTAIAFAVNYFTKKQAPLSVTPPAVLATQDAKQSRLNAQSPTPTLAQPVRQDVTAYQAPAPPVEQPAYPQLPVRPSHDFSNSQGMQNSKLRGLRDITDQN